MTNHTNTTGDGYTVQLGPDNQVRNPRPGCEYRTLGGGMWSASFTAACAKLDQDGAIRVPHKGGRRVKRVYELPAALAEERNAARKASRAEQIPGPLADRPLEDGTRRKRGGGVASKDPKAFRAKGLSSLQSGAAAAEARKGNGGGK